MASIIERLAEMAAKAPPTPWRCDDGCWPDYIVDARNANVAAEVETEHAAFIVAAINALPDLLTVARAAGPFVMCRREVCGGCSHEYHGTGACWGLADPPCSCLLDWPRLCGTCDACALRAALEPLLRECES